MVTVGAVVLLADEDSIDGLALMVRVGAAYVVGLPLIGWPLLRPARVRPAWLVAVLAPAVLYLIFTITRALVGDCRSLRYGLLGAAAYAASAALVTVTVAARERWWPTKTTRRHVLVVWTPRRNRPPPPPPQDRKGQGGRRDDAGRARRAGVFQPAPTG